MAIVNCAAQCSSPSVTFIQVGQWTEFMSHRAVLSHVWSESKEDKFAADARSMMQTMRQKIKLLRQDASRGNAHLAVLTPTSDMFMKAALVWALSDSIELAVLFAHQWQRRWQMHSNHALQRVTHVDIQFKSWELMMDPRFQEARVNLTHPWREEVDIFLMESLLRDFVAMQSDRDLSVPLSALVLKYTNLWRHRPRPPRMQKTLELLGEANYSAKWAWGFRRRWDLGVMRPGNRPALSRVSLQSKVLSSTCLHQTDALSRCLHSMLRPKHGTLDLLGIILHIGIGNIQQTMQAVEFVF